jgi:hypothetical protein
MVQIIRQISSHDGDRKTFEVITSTLPHVLLVSLVTSTFHQGNIHRKNKIQVLLDCCYIQRENWFCYQYLD